MVHRFIAFLNVCVAAQSPLNPHEYKTHESDSIISEGQTSTNETAPMDDKRTAHPACASDVEPLDVDWHEVRQKIKNTNSEFMTYCLD